MEKYIQIPEQQYYKMLKSYDEAIEELERMKKAFEELADSTKAE